ncbi:MAG TPA: acetate kinase [Thermodesulfobacteriota bacterium]|nr:acetate kinase [Thermodesulfobacteriota bacterium]
MKILVINAGSSSVKFTCMKKEDFTVLASGVVERIGLPGTRFHYKRQGAEDTQEARVENAYDAVALIASSLCDVQSGVMRSAGDIVAIGHRVVHGGERITAPTLIDDRTKEIIRECSELAPLHNPPNLEGIEACEKIFPGVPQVGVFDTAFHSTIPARAFLYAIPIGFYRNDGVRRYGFHGTSHKYVSSDAARLLNREIEALNIITCHLGNGCSMAAVQGGRCVDTSMGLTPLEGLIMGTRCGDLDPAIIFYLLERTAMAPAEMNEMLNKKSGMLGLAGIGSSDMRDIEQKIRGGHGDAKTAFDAFCYRIQKYIGAYIAAMGGVDALVFTAGIGENSEMVRAGVCTGLEGLGIVLDPGKNASMNRTRAEIHDPKSQVKILIVPTNEELQIARETVEVLESQRQE